MPGRFLEGYIESFEPCKEHRLVLMREVHAVWLWSSPAAFGANFWREHVYMKGSLSNARQTRESLIDGTAMGYRPRASRDATGFGSVNSVENGSL